MLLVLEAITLGSSASEAHGGDQQASFPWLLAEGEKLSQRKKSSSRLNASALSQAGHR